MRKHTGSWTGIVLYNELADAGYTLYSSRGPQGSFKKVWSAFP